MVIPEKGSCTDRASEDPKNCKYPQLCPSPHAGPKEGRKERRKEGTSSLEMGVSHKTRHLQIPGIFLKHFCIKSFLKCLRSHCHFSNKTCCDMHVSASHSTNCSPEDFSGLVERGNVTQFLKYGWSSVSKLHVVPSMALGHTPTLFCSFFSSNTRFPLTNMQISPPKHPDLDVPRKQSTSSIQRLSQVDQSHFCVTIHSRHCWIQANFWQSSEGNSQELIAPLKR